MVKMVQMMGYLRKCLRSKWRKPKIIYTGKGIAKNKAETIGSHRP